MYDQDEISKLQEEYKTSIKEAFKTYCKNIEEIFNHGCTEESMKDNFIKESKDVLDYNVNERAILEVVKESTKSMNVW